MNGLRLFGNHCHCLSFTRRTQRGERRFSLVVRPLCGGTVFWAQANGLPLSRAAAGGVGWSELLGRLFLRFLHAIS